MKTSHALAIIFILTASAALAHKNVKNASVKARMDAMSTIAANMKILGAFAKGTAPFDQGQARAAALTIAKHAAQTSELFLAPEDDPLSEALPLIWQDFDDFSAKAKELQVLATKFSASISDQQDVGPAMVALGGACKSCHKLYRE
ncbi:MAG: cytochrome c [Paracoccaceae bacterium]